MVRMRILGAVAGVLALQVTTWVLRTRAYVACCAPAAATDPYANMRASSYPGFVAAASVLLALFLNGIFLFVLMRTERRTAGVTASRVLQAFAVGTAFISLPIAIVAHAKSSGLNAGGFTLLLMGPTLAGFLLWGRSQISRAG